MKALETFLDTGLCALIGGNVLLGLVNLAAGNLPGAGYGAAGAAAAALCLYAKGRLS